jgi:hypothetical protein
VQHGWGRGSLNFPSYIRKLNVINQQSDGPSSEPSTSTAATSGFVTHDQTTNAMDHPWQDQFDFAAPDQETPDIFDNRMQLSIGPERLDITAFDIQPFIDMDSLPRPAHLFGIDRSPFDNTDPFAVAMDRESFDRILSSFFEYVYPICPVPNKESLLADLARKRELLPHQDEWRNMVLGLVAFTVIQVPSTLLLLSRDQARNIVHACSEHVREYLSREYEEITIDRRKQ